MQNPYFSSSTEIWIGKVFTIIFKVVCDYLFIGQPRIVHDLSFHHFPYKIIYMRYTVYIAPCIRRNILFCPIFIIIVINTTRSFSLKPLCAVRRPYLYKNSGLKLERLPSD